MTAPIQPRARLQLLIAVVLYLTAAVTLVLLGTPLAVGQAVANGAFMAIGAIIFVRKPGNVVGVLIVALGVLWNAIHAADVAAAWYAEAGAVEVASWIGFVFSPILVFATWLQVPMILLFPHGRVSSVWDRRFMRGTGIYASMVALLALVGRPLVMAGPTAAGYPHPFVDAELADQLGEVGGFFFFLILVSFLVATVRLIMRARRSDPVERRQIGWVGFACALYFVLGIFINGLINPLGAYENGFAFLDAVLYLAIPTAIAIAIFRFRLYEIDRILSRSVTFGGLAVFIGGVYIAIVVGLGQLLGADAGFGLSIVATVLVALAFQPARRRVEHWANRLVYGERATPHEILVRFSHGSSELSDEELLDRIPQLMVDGTGARSAALWTRRDEGFETAAVWPPDAGSRRLDGDAFVDPDADWLQGVFHDDELLGGLSLVKEEGETVTPAEEGLLSDLASGLGLALRNARLTGELRRQVEELETSRQRVLAVADAARRELENTLDSGPQQQLVALKVKLGPTRKRAEQLGAVKTAGLLGQLEQQAGDAIKAVREFAGGIYPPLLEAEGLVVAIGQQARVAAIPVSIDGDAVGRYSRDVEAAVYFSVLEALQNVGKYAEASAVTVTLSANDGMLTFEVADDGRGFDPASVAPGAGLNGIADRLDTIGGTVDVDSAPGAGTTMTGTIPIRAPIQAEG